MDRKLTVTSAREFVTLQAALRLLDHKKQTQIQELRQSKQNRMADLLTEQREHIVALRQRWTDEYTAQSMEELEATIKPMRCPNCLSAEHLRELDNLHSLWSCGFCGRQGDGAEFDVNSAAFHKGVGNG